MYNFPRRSFLVYCSDTSIHTTRSKLLSIKEFWKTFLARAVFPRPPIPADEDGKAPRRFVAEKQIQNRLLLFLQAYHIRVGGLQNYASLPHNFFVYVPLPFVTRGEINDSVPLLSLPGVIDPLQERLDLSAELVAA